MEKDIHYIVVDLDGTLIKTDLFVESIIKLIKQNPLNIFRLLIWILQGRSVAKDKIANLIKINVKYLPYEQNLINYLKEKKRHGNTLILATASHKHYANKVAEYLKLFDHVISSSARINLKGRNKLKAIKEIVGNKSFVYAGNGSADRPIWNEASCNIFVNAPCSDINIAESQGKIEKVIRSRGPILNAFLKQMRPQQWAKNLLVFVPLLTSHSYHDPISVLNTLLAFLCFSLCASGVYFLNDLLDLEADRRHHRKRFRPLASGDLALSFGVVGAIVLPLMALAISLITLPLGFSIILALYYSITNVYSFFLKRISTADIMTLAVLYTMRIIAGAVAIEVKISSWLMAFSVFVFVSLAYLKRYIEISSLNENSKIPNGRGYSESDSETMFSLGIANITASVLILSLYITSEEVIDRYSRPEVLWLLCFVMLYWGNRIWVGARRGKIADDPVVFAIKDTVSRMCGIAFVIVVLIAEYL